MVVIGVTGGVGTGKTTVANMLKRLGAVVLDADAIAHEVMEPKRLAWREIVKAFGEDVLNGDQTVNRRRLAALVFRDESSRKRLERIIHPRVLREINARLHRLRRPSTACLDSARRCPERANASRGTLKTPSRARVEGRRSRKARVVVLDIPLLIEAGARELVDVLVVVTAPPEVQRQRLHAKFGWTEEETDARIRAQWDLSAKAALADAVVDNADGVETTRTQVKRLWNRLGLRSSKSSISQR